MPTAEAARARELLVSNTAGTTGGLVDDGGKISANVFHTRSLVKIVKRSSQAMKIRRTEDVEKGNFPIGRWCYCLGWVCFKGVKRFLRPSPSLSQDEGTTRVPCTGYRVGF